MLDAARGAQRRFKEPDAILTALGYAAGPAGERRLLEALARLRLAFVAQQQRSPGAHGVARALDGNAGAFVTNWAPSIVTQRLNVVG